jgi:hypothetical protein
MRWAASAPDIPTGTSCARATARRTHACAANPAIIGRRKRRKNVLML